jgi:cyclophilin family peptidyl-prolyl cis-trans isomerase
MITTLVSALLLAVAPAAGEPKASLAAPDVWVSGGRCEVRLTLTASADGASVPGWQVTPAGFAVDGQPLAEHAELAPIALAANESKTFAIDLGPALKATKDFELAFGDQKALVRVLEPAPKGLNFMDEAAMPVAELEKHWVVLDTVRGQMVVEFYPALAPNHVRNFLDLSSSGFYNGTIFHRVAPGFMAQGGDPTGTGGGDGKRKLKLEATRYKKHVKGILSMARTPDPNSASCQFFIMHGSYPSLDGGYSIFGNLVRGYATLDQIVRTKGSPIGDGTVRPSEQQAILSATVVKMPANPDDGRQGPDGKPLPKAEPAPATAK